MIISFTCLHYGVSYLRYALKSVAPYVDACYVLYSPHGSHGHQTSEPCPETREELFAQAILGAGKKLRWYDGDWKREHEHRGAIHQICPEAKQIIVLDSDEIWPAALIDHVTERCTEWHDYRIELVHFWRSFRRAVVNDEAAPVRVVNPQGKKGEVLVDPDIERICHMGYAQPEAITRYKQLTHGHKAEWRADWYEKRFLANALFDCHPTSANYWNPIAVDPLDYLPEWMKDHPFWDMEVIR